VITPEWAPRAFPTCIECCAYHEQRDSLWAVVRHCPDLADAYIRIAEGRAFGDLERSRAVRRLGETGQERAYDYLIRLLFRLLVGHETRGDAIRALGSGPAPSPRALHTLAELLRTGTPEDQSHALHALERANSEAAGDILEHWRSTRPRSGVSPPVESTGGGTGPCVRNA
jgi:HEAT repeat protein